MSQLKKISDHQNKAIIVAHSLNKLFSISSPEKLFIYPFISRLMTLFQKPTIIAIFKREYKDNAIKKNIVFHTAQEPVIREVFEDKAKEVSSENQDIVWLGKNDSLFMAIYEMNLSDDSIYPVGNNEQEKDVSFVQICNGKEDLQLLKDTVFFLNDFGEKNNIDHFVSELAKIELRKDKKREDYRQKIHDNQGQDFDKAGVSENEIHSYLKPVEHLVESLYESFCKSSLIYKKGSIPNVFFTLKTVESNKKRHPNLYSKDKNGKLNNKYKDGRFDYSTRLIVPRRQEKQIQEFFDKNGTICKFNDNCTFKNKFIDENHVLEECTIEKGKICNDLRAPYGIDTWSTQDFGFYGGTLHFSDRLTGCGCMERIKDSPVDIKRLRALFCLYNYIADDLKVINEYGSFNCKIMSLPVHVSGASYLMVHAITNNVRNMKEWLNNYYKYVGLFHPTFAKVTRVQLYKKYIDLVKSIIYDVLKNIDSYSGETTKDILFRINNHFIKISRLYPYDELYLTEEQKNNIHVNILKGKNVYINISGNRYYRKNIYEVSFTKKEKIAYSIRKAFDKAEEDRIKAIAQGPSIVRQQDQYIVNYKKLHKVAKSLDPVLLISKDASDRARYARMIHRDSDYRGEPFAPIVYHPSMEDVLPWKYDNKWCVITLNSKNRIYQEFLERERGTIFIDKIDKLDFSNKGACNVLKSFITIKTVKPRFIFGSIEPVSCVDFEKIGINVHAIKIDDFPKPDQMLIKTDDVLERLSDIISSAKK